MLAYAAKAFKFRKCRNVKPRRIFLFSSPAIFAIQTIADSAGVLWRWDEHRDVYFRYWAERDRFSNIVDSDIYADTVLSKYKVEYYRKIGLIHPSNPITPENSKDDDL